jgi:hypothetical protein
MSNKKLIKDKNYKFKYRGFTFIASYRECIFNTYIFNTATGLTCYLSETEIKQLF